MFFSAHGVPVSYVENSGDPYQKQMEECIDLIMEELKSRGVQNNHILAYQVWFILSSVIYKLAFVHYLFCLKPCN